MRFINLNTENDPHNEHRSGNDEGKNIFKKPAFIFFKAFAIRNSDFALVMDTVSTNPAFN